MRPPHEGELAELQYRAAGGMVGEPVPDRAFGAKFWTAIVVATSIFGGSMLLIAPLGPLTRHMSGHILLMNGIVPFLAIALIARRGDIADSSWLKRSLVVASAIQIIALWSAHAPAAMEAAARNAVVHSLVQTGLLGAALWFWLSVLAQRDTARYRALFALLITGKLFCLLAALMVFSPRLLYPAHTLSHAHVGAANVDPFSDQQLAGLLMLVVCPLTYVLAGIIIAEKWLRELAGDMACGPSHRSKPISAR